MKYLKIYALAALAAILLASVVIGAQTFRQIYFPSTDGDRFWQSNAAANTNVTYTDKDTIVGSTIFKSKWFSMTTDGRDWISGEPSVTDAEIVTANEIVLHGRVVMCTVAKFCDSVGVKYWCQFADGDSGVFAADTIRFDTTGMNIDAGETMAFEHVLSPTDAGGNAIYTDKMAISTYSLETTSGDSLFTDDWRVIIRWKD